MSGRYLGLLLAFGAVSLVLAEDLPPIPAAVPEKPVTPAAGTPAP